MRVLNSTLKQFFQQKKLSFTLFDALKKQSIFMTAFLLLSVSYLKTTAQVASGTAPLTVPTGGFQIEGDLQANTPVAGKGDWLPGNAGAGGNVLTAAGVPVNATTTFHLTDLYNTSENNFSGGKKFNDNPNIWTWTTNSALGKCDINNALFHFATSNVGGVLHTWLIVAADRRSNSGNAYIDFELLKNTMTDNADGTFSSAGPNNGRTAGDVLLTLALTNGGGAAEFFVNIWDNPTGPYDYIDKTALTPAGAVYASTNAGTVPVSFGAFGLNQYSSNLFVEAAIDLTALLGAINPCTSLGVKTLFIKTKTSQSPTATIVDFISAKQVSLQIGVANAGQDQLQCGSGFSVTGAATPSPGDAVSSTTWSVVSGSASIASPSALTSGVTVTGSPATLRFTVTTTFGCTVSDDLILSVKPGPLAPSATPTQPTCTVATGSITITGVSGETYSFDGAAFSSTLTYGSLAAGSSHTIVAKNAATCTSPTTNISLNVQPASPLAPSATPTQPTCTVATGSIIITGVSGETYKFDAGAFSATLTYGSLAAGSSHTIIAKNGAGCTSPTTTITLDARPANPTFTVCVVQPTLCTTGSLTINATGGTGFLYTINGTDPTAANTNNVFSNLGVGSVTTIKVKNSDGCSATPVNCADIVSDCSAPAARLAKNTAPVNTADITEKQTTIKAYPNPFTDKVKFVVNSTVSGTGNLQVYNTMGQKIKTVYAGLITTGIHNFELSLPVKNASNLVYILRIGDKKMTGRLLQMNR